MLLLIPGPVQTRPETRAAMAQDIAPWDLDFRAVYAGIRDDVRRIAGGVEGVHATLPLRPAFAKNVRIQGILLYTVRPEHLRAAAEDVTAAVVAGALRVGEEVGVPLHHFPLEETAAAHDAVEGGAVGKVLIDVG